MTAKQFFNDFGKALYCIDGIYDEFARKSGVAPTLLWILYALNDGKAHTQKDICVDWALPKSTVNTIVSELKQNGYVELVPLKGTRREMTVVLTHSGKVYANTVLAEIYQKESDVFEQLNGEEAKLAATMQKLAELLKKQ